MSWLHKIRDAAKVTSTLIPVWGPIISAAIPGSKDDKIIERTADAFTQISTVIQQAEAFGAAIKAPGVQKLEMAAPSVAQIILRSAAFADKEVADAARFEAGCKAIAHGMAEVLSSVKER